MAASLSLLCLLGGFIGYLPFQSSRLEASGLRTVHRLTASDAENLVIQGAIGNNNKSW